MDTFFEQLVTIRKSDKTLAAFIGIWLLGILISLLLFLTMFFGSLTLILIFGVMFGTYWLSSKLNVEFEYIITNDSMDIDKIINKSERKRILSFDIAKVTRLEKYNPALLNGINNKEIVFACNTNDDDVYFMVAESSHGGKNAYLVFAPDKRIKSGIKKFAPKYLTNSMFE